MISYRPVVYRVSRSSVCPTIALQPRRFRIAPSADGCKRGLAGPLIQSNFLNCSIVKPASRTMPPIVYWLTGLLRGIVMIRVPSVITICLPRVAIVKPLFSKARTARRWLTPGSFGTPSTPLLPLPESWSVLKLLRPLQGTPEWRIGCSRVPLARSCPATSNPEGPDTKRCSLPLIFSVRLCISWRHHSDSAFAVTPVQLTIALQPRRSRSRLRRRLQRVVRHPPWSPAAAARS